MLYIFDAMFRFIIILHTRSTAFHVYIHYSCETPTAQRETTPFAKIRKNTPNSLSRLKFFQNGGRTFLKVL